MRLAVSDQAAHPKDKDSCSSPTSPQPSNAIEESVISVSLTSTSTTLDCPPPSPSRDSTTAAIPSTSSSSLTPQDICP
ncbi:hypothetical protein E2C01_032947 [Portunus trituberculatus]|uniref:Uncharacterized protein n=1 Tax=Portunus trituberculatus TaxID=210409 RepID=A0A5B7EX91_PORTR|nr:hypothetical protein [Portunus trituberculatus]